MNYCYKFPKADVTTDIILIHNNSILLIKRKNEPFKDHWAFPGGFIDLDEDLIDTAKRELKEETNIDNVELYQYKTYGKPNRDPRGRTITVVYYAIIDKIPNNIKASDDAKELGFFNLTNLPKLAFDHETILKDFINDILNGEIIDEK